MEDSKHRQTVHTETVTERVTHVINPRAQSLLEVESPEKLVQKGLMKVAKVAQKKLNGVERPGKENTDPKNRSMLEVSGPRRTTKTTRDRIEEVVFRRRIQPPTNVSKTVNKSKTININVKGLFEKTKQAVADHQSSSVVNNHHYHHQQQTTCVTCMQHAYHGYYR